MKSCEAIVLCHKSALQEGQSLGFDTRDCGTDTVFLVRFHGRIYGWRNSCPHISGAPMAWKRHAYMDATHNYIECHAHGALFEPQTGLCVQGPCSGRRLEPIKIEEREDGFIVLSGAEQTGTGVSIQ